MPDGGQVTAQTIFIRDFFVPATEYARLVRRSNDSPSLAQARDRVAKQNADLAAEINETIPAGHRLVSVIEHPPDAKHPNDLMITILISRR
jgi:hypothetical protein